ncbi:hypothetical protein ACIHCV_38625 [Streptomyces sp. NPDC051956]|uniref:hypothetical protein n=1 Tax=Streptomyces sp. NPDC051956 TaxID=3365677 RepID=UPI0037D2A7ED
MLLPRFLQPEPAFLHVPSREAIMPPPPRVETPQSVAIVVIVRASTLIGLILAPWALAAGHVDYPTCAAIAMTMTASRGSYAAYRRIQLR